MVELVYNSLRERAGTDTLSFRFVQSEFRVRAHPRVAQGLMEEEEALRDFVDGLQECLAKDGGSDPEVTLENFNEFYGNLSGGPWLPRGIPQLTNEECTMGCTAGTSAVGRGNQVPAGHPAAY